MNALTHTCHAIGCTTPCKPEQLMCRLHWSRVPGLVQPIVYAFFRKGQCDDKQPSAEWTAAAMCAVVMVALRSKLTRTEFLNGLRGWVMSVAAHFEDTK